MLPSLQSRMTVIKLYLHKQSWWILHKDRWTSTTVQQVLQINSSVYTACFKAVNKVNRWVRSRKVGILNRCACVMCVHWPSWCTVTPFQRWCVELNAYHHWKIWWKYNITYHTTTSSSHLLRDYFSRCCWVATPDVLWLFKLKHLFLQKLSKTQTCFGVEKNKNKPCIK